MKKYLVPLILIAGLMLTACTPDEAPAANGVFIGGSQGIVINFEPFGVEEDGTYTIFDIETFPLEVTLKKTKYCLKCITF